MDGCHNFLVLFFGGLEDVFFWGRQTGVTGGNPFFESEKGMSCLVELDYVGLCTQVCCPEGEDLQVGILDSPLMITGM